MSVRVMSWVWEHSQSKGTDRLVLLAVADCAADNGGNAYPSMAALVRKTGLSIRTVQQAIRRLVELGELAVALNAGPGGCNRYRIRMAPAGSAPPQEVHPETTASPNDVHPPEPDAPPPPNQMHHPPERRAPGTVLEPSLEPSEISSLPRKSAAGKRGTRIPDDFTVTPAMVEWARERVPHVDGRHETEKFINYWRAKSGTAATKLDWPATWRNWMLTAAERTPGNALAVRNGHQPKPSTTDQRVAAGLALAEDLKRRRQP